MVDKKTRVYKQLSNFIMEYKEKNITGEYRPVAVGRYGIRTRESIYSKELAKDYTNNKLIYKDTLTVGMGSVQIDIGILSEDEIYSVSPAYHTYKINAINSDYLRYCLQCRNQDMFMRYVKRGSRQGKAIDLKRWLNYEIPLYNDLVQKEIVNRLDIVQKIISLRQNELEHLDNLIKSRFVEMFGDPVLNPRNWEMVELSQIAEIKIGPFGTLLHKEDYISGGHALVNPSHIIEGKICCDNNLSISEEKYCELESYSLKKFDLVLGRRGEMGRCAVVNEEGLLCGTGSLIIRSNGEISSEILQKIISFPSFKKTIEDKAVGQTMPNLNVSIVSKLLIPRIPSEVQNEYFTFVQQVDKLKVEVQKSLDETQVLFDSLMQEYFE